MTTIEWSPILQKAFEDVKEIVRRDLSLVVRDPNALLVLCTDASELGLGFVLAQPKPEFRHLDKKLIRPEHLEILKYGSVGITNNLTHGGSTKRELAGVIFAIKKCYDELVGNDFLLITDHEALVWLFTQEHTSPMLHRWIDLLMSLSFTVLHWLGLWNFLADAMSRPSCTNATMIKDIPATELPEHEERIEAYQLGEERSTELKEKAAFIRNKTIPNENERQQIIKDTHEEGHFGIQQTFLKIWHKGLWWPKIREQITKEIENCQTCLRHTTKRVGFHPLTPITESRPNEGWAVDLFFATEQEGKGGRLHPILIAMDICTGFVLDLKIMKTKQATEVSDELWKMICVFGPPKYLISDNGKEFLNQTLARLFKTIGTQHRTISSYHASANGRPERAIQDVKTLIKKLTEGNLRNLEKLLPKIQLAYNTRISSRTLSAPFALEFGRNANAFEDYRKLPEMKEVNEEEIKRNWDKMNKTILPAINERVVEREEQRAAKWDATHNVIDRYTPGQFVMAKEVVPGSKWNEKWVGPFEVIRCNRNGAYTLRNALGEEEPYRFPPNHLIHISHYEFPEEESHEVKRILDARGSYPNYEYLVQWRNKDLQDTWEPITAFDSIAPIQKYLKTARAAKLSPKQRTAIEETIKEMSEPETQDAVLSTSRETLMNTTNPGSFPMPPGETPMPAKPMPVQLMPPGETPMPAKPMPVQLMPPGETPMPAKPMPVRLMPAGEIPMPPGETPRNANQPSKRKNTNLDTTPKRPKFKLRFKGMEKDSTNHTSSPSLNHLETQSSDFNLHSKEPYENFSVKGPSSLNQLETLLSNSSLYSENPHVESSVKGDVMMNDNDAMDIDVNIKSHKWKFYDKSSPQRLYLRQCCEYYHACEVKSNVKERYKKEG